MAGLHQKFSILGKLEDLGILGGVAHRGSTSNIGTSTVLSCAVAAFCSTERPAPTPRMPATTAAPQMKCRCCMSLIMTASLLFGFISPFATHELEPELFLGP